MSDSPQSLQSTSNWELLNLVNKHPGFPSTLEFHINIEPVFQISIFQIICKLTEDQL